MVLRSGIILPFQFRDIKKLLMIGVAEENRDLSIWDLRNVVRAAFGIYNFEFRNKKIGFDIPDDLLLNYLAQRHDLTNFVIEIGQASDDDDDDVDDDGSNSSTLGNDGKENASFEPSQSAQKLNNNSTDMLQKTADGISAALTQLPGYGNEQEQTQQLDKTGDAPSNQEPSEKLRIAQAYAEHTIESLTQSINPMDIIPKSEQEAAARNMARRANKFASRAQLMPPQQQNTQLSHQQQQIPHHQPHLLSTAPPFFVHYGTPSATPTPTPSMHSHSHPHPPTTPTPYAHAMMNRFRRRGERMSKDQKEMYVKYFEENPCMLSQRRNDAMLEPHWNKLASVLNAVPQGAVKNVEEWKQTFDAWRYRVFMYTRYNSKLTGAIAQNPKNYKPLTATDQRAYAMWTNHKHATLQDFEKMPLFANLDETQHDYNY